jgi:Family of unknown function (DUF5309)
MATTDYLSSADLKNVLYKGLIREDVMQKIYDISRIPLPFTDMIGTDSTSNSYCEWTQDQLQAVNLNNAQVDGADASTTGNMSTGSRVGNQCQISDKIVMVTERADDSDVIGQSSALAYQLMMRQQELKRDMEAIMLTQQASQADNGNATPGLIGGFGAWLTSNVSRGATGTSGGFANGIVAAPTLGTARAISETTIRDVSQSIYQNGGDATILMTTPSVVRLISEYMFTASARIATLMSDTGQAASPQVAKGSVNIFVTDFATLTITPNRLMQPVDATHTNVYLIDPAYARQTFLKPIVTRELAKTGTADKRQISCDWTLKVLTEKAHGVIADIDPALAMVA